MSGGVSMAGRMGARGMGWEIGAVVRNVFEESDDASPPTGTRKEYRTEFEHDLLGRAAEDEAQGPGTGLHPAR